MCAAAAIPISSTLFAESRKPADGRKLRYVGWQIGVTYQSDKPQGLDRDYFLRLLDEMASHRMNLLSIMMLSLEFLPF